MGECQKVKTLRHFIFSVHDFWFIGKKTTYFSHKGTVIGEGGQIPDQLDSAFDQSADSRQQDDNGA